MTAEEFYDAYAHDTLGHGDLCCGPMCDRCHICHVLESLKVGRRSGKVSFVPRDDEFLCGCHGTLEAVRKADMTILMMQAKRGSDANP